MSDLQRIIHDLVIGHRILAHQGVFDEYGHVSARHPADPRRFLMARACAAAFVEPQDILEFTETGVVARASQQTASAADIWPDFVVHAAIYGARPEVKAVVCAASEDVLPFSITATPLRGMLGSVGDMGTTVPVWDITERFGSDTDLTVSTLDQARDLAQRLGKYRSVLIRGGGFVVTGRTLNDAVKTSVYYPKNARTLAQSLALGPVRSMSQGEVDARLAIDPESNAMRRGWEYWARQAGCQRWL